MFNIFYPRFPAAGSDTTDLMLAPLVAAMRMPVMTWEMLAPGTSGRRKESERAVFEKAAALFETYGTVQTEMTHAVVKLWIASASGTRPDVETMTKAWNDLMNAGTGPSARRVRENYRRLLKAQR